MPAHIEPSCQADITFLNLRTLLLAREVGKRSIGEAVIRFGLDSDTVKALCNVPVEVVEHVARAEKVCFRPVVSARQLIEASVYAATRRLAS